MLPVNPLTNIQYILYKINVSIQSSFVFLAVHNWKGRKTAANKGIIQYRFFISRHFYGQPERSHQMPRRGTNIYKRKDGRWEGRILYEQPSRQQKKYRSVYGRTYQETRQKMEQEKELLRKGNSTADLTIQEAAGIWLSDRSPYLKVSTASTYRNMIETHIVPRTGDLLVSQFNQQAMELFASGVRSSRKEYPLSLSYTRSICSLLLTILSHVRKKYGYHMELPENPISTEKKRQLQIPGEGSLLKLEKYLTAHAKEDTCLGILIAFHTGIRLGELCALTWADIDLEEKILFIRKSMQRTSEKNETGKTQVILQEPKSLTSMRSIPIPPVLLPFLEEYRKPADCYVIRGRKRKYAEPRTLQYRFAEILHQCHVEGFHFHMLRHAFATRCIDMGFDVKSLSEILGHSNVQITMNLYVHSTMQRKKQLMNLFTARESENPLP